MRLLVTLLLIFTALSLPSDTLAQAGKNGPPTIYYRADFDDQRLPKHQGWLVAFVYTEKGKKRLAWRLQHENTYGESPYAYTFAESSVKEVMVNFGVSLKGPERYLTASRDLWCAFCIYTKKGSGRYDLTVWNDTKKANKSFAFRTVADAWQVVRVNLFGPGLLDKGDRFRSMSIHNRGSGPRSWVLDNLVIWKGPDHTPPARVTDVEVVRKGNRNVLKWTPVADNIFVQKYKIYRGTIPGFSPNDKTLLGESTSGTYVDALLLRDSGYFYIVRAVDCNGNLSPLAPGSRGAAANLR